MREIGSTFARQRGEFHLETGIKYIGRAGSGIGLAGQQRMDILGIGFTQ